MTKPIYLIPRGGAKTFTPNKHQRTADMRRNNPDNRPVGDFTGRCAKCGSTNLWDDQTAYGCNDCGWTRFTG